MRALGGGEGGVLDLNQIRLEGQVLDFDQAIDTWTSRAEGRYVGPPPPSVIRPDARLIYHPSIWTYRLKILDIHLNQI